MLETEEQTFPDVQSFMEATESEAPEAETEEVEDGEEVEELDFEDSDEADPAELEEDIEASDDDSEDVDEDEGDETPDLPAVEPPGHLMGDEQEVFASLDRKGQQIVSDLAKRGEQVLNKKLEEAALTRQLFEQRMDGLTGFISENERQLAEYDNIDWVAAGQQYSAEEILQAQAHRDQLRKEVENAKKTAIEAEQVHLQEHTRQSFARLHEKAATDPIAKALIDPAKGQERLQAVREYALKNGADPQALAYADDVDAMFAYKAMLYDQGQAKAKSAKKKPKAARKQVRSAPGGSTSTSATKRMKALQSKPSLTVAEGAELMRLERARKSKRKAG